MGEFELNRVLVNNVIETESLSIVFQPIFNSQQNIPLGYEALTRGAPGHPLQSPAKLFQVASEVGMLSELELLCRKLAIARFAELKLEGLLFINVSPLTIEQNNHPHGETLSYVEQSGLIPEQIVIEVTERFAAEKPEFLKASLQHYRNFGFKIAIDDLGTGHSGLMQWAELRPDIVKIDRYFISNCANNIVKRELLRTIFELGRATGVEIVAEGIEREDEFLTLKNLGMKYAQGFLLAKPEFMPARTMPLAYHDTSSKDREIGSASQENDFEIGHLLVAVEALPPNINCLEVHRLFKRDKAVNSKVVVDELNQPIGVVYRDQLAELFSSDFGHALYDRKAISEVMEPIPFTVDIASSIDEVSHLITEDPHFDQRSDFVVVRDGVYLGVANVRSLLKKMTEEKIKHAQHANPLTMLPGNVVIQEKVKHLLNHRQRFQMAYFDLDHFKPFNDLYGYASGDEVIKLVAELLSEVCLDNFIGHVGGDDFVVIFTRGDGEALCRRVLDEFSQRILTYYKPGHIDDQGYYANDRNGNQLFFPLLSLSCGILDPDLAKLESPLDVAQLASQAKKEAKHLAQGEVFVLNMAEAVIESKVKVA